jgi:hypothetical protein
MALNYADQIQLLRATNPDFKKYEQDVIQAVVDTLTSVNLFAEAEKRRIEDIAAKIGLLPGNDNSHNTFTKIQEINKNLMKKIRKMEK